MHKGNWYTLDNTAKLMPSLTNNLNTNVFRLVCTLKSEVDKDILQNALDEALKEFPIFSYTMKSGIFWHYLEQSSKSPKVEKENTDPCARIDSEHLFRVSYYKKRINLEVYHVLSDGNGSMEFFKYLISTYLNKKYDLRNTEAINDSSLFEKNSDDFKKFDKSSFKVKIQKSDKAYKLKLPKKNNVTHDIIEIHMSLSDLKSEAKKKDATITVYVMALFIDSIIKNARIRDLKRPIGITVPVDLRSTFPSHTSRNFFYTICIQYLKKDNYTIEDIIEEIKRQFGEKLTKEHLQEMLDTYMIVEKFILIRVVPNFLKDFILSYINKMAKKGETAAFTNINMVKLPKIYEKYIESFSGFASTNELELAAVSYKDDIALSFSSHIQNKDIERAFIKSLQGITDKEIRVISNMREE